jgi:hypothetical protein
MLNRQTSAQRGQTLDYLMLLAIDGKHHSRVEFEEQCRLRTLRGFGIVAIRDETGTMRVDWSTWPWPIPAGCRMPNGR